MTEKVKITQKVYANKITGNLLVVLPWVMPCDEEKPMEFALDDQKYWVTFGTFYYAGILVQNEHDVFIATHPKVLDELEYVGEL